MLYDREEIAQRAEAARTNEPGTCQLWARTMAGAPSAGDVDRDGDYDAVDGWKKEPESAKHYDRNPPRGVPVAFSGGSRGYGHRAISLGGGKIRSTDMSSTGYRSGVVGTTTIEQIERSMGVHYSGWSSTFSALPIPLPGPAKQTRPDRGENVNVAIRKLAKAKGSGQRGTLIERAKAALKKIKPVK